MVKILPKMDYKKEDILNQLQKITSDKAFSRSKINVRLLTFLIHATLENKDIKETTIGISFFGKKYDPIKSDNKVRVYVYHLRKKLDEYYRSSALKDEIVFVITKGQYKVQFQEFKTPKASSKNNNKFVYYLATAIAIFACLLWFQTKKTGNVFWSSLMETNMPTTVIFGDYFMMEGRIYPDRGRLGTIRDYEINSNKDFENFITKHPEKAGKFTPSKHHYFNWMAPYCSKLIGEYWSKYDYPFEIQQVSEWNVSQLNKENMVYFGQSKTMGVLKNILKENFPQYTFQNQQINRIDPKTQLKTVYRDVISHNQKITDYTIVAKIHMPAGNEIRFFLSDQDCGAISALEYFVRKDSTEQFFKRHQLKKTDDFIALFKVTGWQRKSYTMEFLLLDKISKP